MVGSIVKTVLSPELLAQVKELAAINGTSVSQIIRKMVMDGFRKDNQEGN